VMQWLCVIVSLVRKNILMRELLEFIFVKKGLEHMQKISSKILIISTLLAVLLSSSLAVDIGIAWEFNEDDNAEGWVASSSVTDLIISDGTLKTTVTDISPRIIGPPFTLIAEKYGFFHIRLRAPGVEFMQIIWKPSTTLFGGIGIELIGDSLFHEYEIPVYHINSWQGDILGITS
jgi:hypothetical protein